MPLLMRLWIMQVCNSNASCHLGIVRTLHMLERLYWWIEIGICACWWLRHSLKCQAQKRLDTPYGGPSTLYRCLTISIKPPASTVSDPFPSRRREMPTSLLSTKRLSCRADMYTVAAAELTEEGTADALINKYIILWGSPATLLSANGFIACSKLLQAIYQHLNV